MSLLLSLVVVGCSSPTVEPALPGPGHIPVLLYHSLGEASSGSGTRLAVAEFRWQMELLVDEGYTAVGVSQVAAFLGGEAGLPPRPVLITFDDGYRSVFEYAHPILMDLGLTSAQFIIVGGRPGEELEWLHHASSGHMSWNQLAEMIAAGTAEVHSHTYGLHRLLPVGEDGVPGNPLTGLVFVDGRVETRAEYRARILCDLTRAREAIMDNLGGDARALAFPWGEYTPEVIDLAVEAGHTLMFTTDSGVVTALSDPTRLPRRTIHPGLTPDAFRALLEPPAD